MKLVVLAESSDDTFHHMIELSKNHKSVHIDTHKCDEEHEYRYLLDNINMFRDSKFEIMIAKYSGRESISKDLGDECSEMIIPFSCNKLSKYYIENPINIFLEMLNSFEKEQ